MLQSMPRWLPPGWLATWPRTLAVLSLSPYARHFPRQRT